MRSTGLSVIVVPRASLLWMPMPAPKNSSVFVERSQHRAELGAADRRVGMPKIVGRAIQCGPELRGWRVAVARHDE